MTELLFCFQSLSCIDDFIVPSITQKNHVLIQVKASSVDIIDIRICAGYGRSYRRLFGSQGPVSLVNMLNDDN